MSDATFTTLAVHTDPLRLACAGFLARYRGNTLRTYSQHLKTYLRWCESVDMPPLEARRPHLEVWLRSLEDRHLASATRAAKFNVIHLFYKYAVIDEIIAANPTEHVDAPKIHEGEQRRTWLPTLDSVTLLNAAMKDSTNSHLFIVFLGQMALRVGEACSLNVDSITEKDAFRIARFIGKGGDTYERVIPFQAHRDLDKLIGDRPGSASLLVNTVGDRLTQASASRLLHRLTRAAGVTRDITPHGLRRSVATNMLAAGVPLRDVQLQLRHADPRMTMRYDQGKNSLDRAAVLPYAATQYGMLAG